MHANDEPAGAGQPAALDGLSERIRNGGRDHYEFLRCMFGELGDKWAILLLLVLETGELRHAALRRALDIFDL